MKPQHEQQRGTTCQAIGPGCFVVSAWTSPPTQTRASRDEVHVWRVSLDQSQAPKFQALLDPDECTRAARFRFQEHRDKFIVARGALRTILGRYLEVEAEALQF